MKSTSEAGTKSLPTREAVGAQKQRKGLVRLWHAGRYSLDGLRSAWSEEAFRIEVMVALPGLPLAAWLSQSWQEMLWLQSALVLLMLVELLNTGMEAIVDLASPQWQVLAKKAKDIGSAAVLVCMCWTAWVWGSFLWWRYFQA